MQLLRDSNYTAFFCLNSYLFVGQIGLYLSERTIYISKLYLHVYRETCVCERLPVL